MVLLMRAIRAAAGASSAHARTLSAAHNMLAQARFSTQSSVYTWGSGSLGQLGHGAFIKSGIRNAYEELSPKLVEAFEGKSIVKLEFGATHSAAIDDKGRVYMWGSNEYNKLGLGPDASDFESLPRLMGAFEGIEIVDISCGDYYTAAVDKDGKMYSWGWGGSTMKGAGGLGHAGGKDEPTPRLLRSLVDQGVPIASVECGEFHTVALSKDGEIWAWGNGEYGRLGNGETDTFEVPEPIEFFADENVVSISAGRDFTFALTDNGELYGWGGNSHNQLGVGGSLTMDHYNMEAIPTLVEGFDGVRVKQFAAGYDHAAAVTDDGRLYMWGSKLWLEPHEMTVLADEKIVQVACGRVYTVALSEDGKVFTFGKGSSNCLGHGDRKNQLQPLQISALANINVVSVSCGDYHMGAIATPHSEAMDKDFSFRDRRSGSDIHSRYQRSFHLSSINQSGMTLVKTMNSSQTLGLLLISLSVLVATTTVLLATIPTDHASITIAVPLWLTQFHTFAIKDPFSGRSSKDPVMKATWRRPSMRTSQDDGAIRQSGGDSATATAWHKLSDLLDDLASRGFYPFGTDQSDSAASLGSYNMWRNEEGNDDDATKDSDACTKLYRDSKQRQVCAISI